MLKIDKIHFWPCKKNTKMDINYENVAYTSKNKDGEGEDYHDVILKEYFFNYEENTGKLIYPQYKNSAGVPIETPEIQFTNMSGDDLRINITIPYKLMKKTYEEYLNVKDFNLLKVNYFVSDFNALNAPRPFWKNEEIPDMSYWFVDDINVEYDKITKEVGIVTLNLKLDEWTTFYDTIWSYKGVINISRMHNQRWVSDTIFNSGKLIPDFQSNQFIRNCDEICSNITDKIQKTPSMPLISSRHWDLTNGLPKDSDFLKWDTVESNSGKVKEKKLLILFWCTRVDQGGDANTGEFSAYQGEITNLDGYVVPMKLLVYETGDPNGIPNQEAIRAFMNQITVDKKGIWNPNKDGGAGLVAYRVPFASITEDLWVDDSFVSAKSSASQAIEWKGDGLTHRLLEINPENKGKLTYFSQIDKPEEWYFIDEEYEITDKEETKKIKGDLWPKMFKDASEIVNQKYLTLNNTDLEPHNFTNNHFNTIIQLFNKNSVTFDISTLLINLKLPNFHHISVKPNTNDWTFTIMERKGTISPDMYDVKYFLLDQDTSIAYKRDNNIMTVTVQGAYTWPFYDNTYNEFIRTNQNQRQAGLDNIAQQYKTGRLNQAIQWGAAGLGGAGAGAIGGATVASNWLKGAGIGFGVGAIAGVLGNVFSNWQKTNELRMQRDNATRSLNAPYLDAKNMQGNINGGSPMTTQADIRFSMQKDDDKDIKNYKQIWTPEITFMQLKDYEAYMVSLHTNKFGYPQNRYLTIDSLHDVMIRKFWNQLQITNFDEFFKKDAIQLNYVFDIITAFINKNGVRLWNLSTTPYEDLFNYTINNYEVNLDSSLLVLEGKLLGPEKE